MECVAHRDIRHAKTKAVEANLQSLDIYTTKPAEGGKSAKPRPVRIMQFLTKPTQANQLKLK